MSRYNPVDLRVYASDVEQIGKKIADTIENRLPGRPHKHRITGRCNANK